MASAPSEPFKLRICVCVCVCVCLSDLCSDSQTLRYNKYGTDRFSVKDSVFSNFGDRIAPSRRYKRFTVRAKLALPVQFWPKNGLSAPTTPMSTSSILSCVDATQSFPGRP